MSLLPSKIKSLIVAFVVVCASGWLQAQEDFLSEEELFEDDFDTQRVVSDPFIGLNRSIFKFNDFVYVKIVGPIAQGYHDLMPDPIENGFNNFFDNLGYPVRLTGNLLQGKIEESVAETGKFLVNSTVGFAGFDDAAADFEGMDPPIEDIGQAFGKWGIGEGFYIVIPFLGPSNARDLVGRLADRIPDFVSKPYTVLEDSTDRWIYSGVDFITGSPELVYRYQLLTESAIDPYEAMKDGFSQYRNQQIRE